MSEAQLTQAKSVLAMAARLHQGGRMAEATAAYELALEAWPAMAEGWHLRGIAAYQSGGSDGARRFVGRSLALDPMLAKGHQLLGAAVEATGESGTAAYAMAARIEPSNSAHWLNLGGALLTKQESKQAFQAFRRACALDPGEAAYFSRLADAGRTGHRPADVESWRSMAATRAPNDAIGQFNHGVALERSGRPVRAAARYRRSLALDPTLASAWTNLGILQTGRQTPTTVASLLRQGLSLSETPSGWLTLGVAEQALGRRVAAIRAFRSGLDLAPMSADLWHNLAGVLSQQGDVASGRRAYRRRWALAPDDAGGPVALALAELASGNYAGAEALLKFVVAMDPARAEAHSALCSVGWRRGRGKAGISAAIRFVALTPGDPKAFIALASSVERLGNAAVSAAAHHMALALTPNDTEMQYSLGLLLATHRRYPEALRVLRKTLALDPEHGDGLLQLASVLNEMGDSDDASQIIDRVRGLAPQALGVQMKLGHILYNRQRLPAALAAYRRAAALAPDHPKPYGNIGTVLGYLWQPAEAERALRRSVFLDPAFPDGWNNLGNNLLEQERFEESRIAFTRGIAVIPDSDQFRFNMSFLTLREGRLAEGFRLYESGITAGIRHVFRTFEMPRWRGEPIDGKRLLVVAEQGLGDEIRFAAAYPAVLEKAGHCIFEVTPRLVSLFRRSFPDATVRSSWPDETGRHLNDADVYAFAGSLPHLMWPERSDFPQKPGFLVPDPERLAACRARINGLPPGLKVGLAWRTGRMVVQSFADMATVDMWAPILALPGITFVNLQYDDCRDELSHVKEKYGVTIHSWSEDDLKNDMELAAALTASLDLVITVAISVNDMAGAVGTECWVMWRGRHGPLGGETQPFFPKHRYMTRAYGEPMAVSVAKAVSALKAKLG